MALNMAWMNRNLIIISIVALPKDAVGTAIDDNLFYKNGGKEISQQPIRQLAVKVFIWRIHS